MSYVLPAVAEVCRFVLRMTLLTCMDRKKSHDPAAPAVPCSGVCTSSLPSSSSCACSSASARPASCLKLAMLRNVQKRAQETAPSSLMYSPRGSAHTEEFPIHSLHTAGHLAVPNVNDQGMTCWSKQSLPR